MKTKSIRKLMNKIKNIEFIKIQRLFTATLLLFSFNCFSQNSNNSNMLIGINSTIIKNNQLGNANVGLGGSNRTYYSKIRNFPGISIGIESYLRNQNEFQIKTYYKVVFEQFRIQDKRQRTVIMSRLISETIEDIRSKSLNFNGGILISKKVNKLKSRIAIGPYLELGLLNIGKTQINEITYIEIENSSSGIEYIELNPIVQNASEINSPIHFEFGLEINYKFNLTQNLYIGLNYQQGLGNSEYPFNSNRMEIAITKKLREKESQN